QKKTRNQYAAKCKYCLLILKDKSERLHRYVLKYNSWPVFEKTSYLTKVNVFMTSIYKQVRSKKEDSAETSSEDNSVENSSSILALNPTKQK
ncbi:15557_t:CDS:1, partial [Cetraspora pellucida]